MIGQGSGVASGNPDPYGPPLPGENQVRELERWCPHGVKRTLVGMARNGRVEGVGPAILDWMHGNGVAVVKQQGVNAGHWALTETGKRLWETLHNRMAGKA